jgi:hypothetical protein
MKTFSKFYKHDKDMCQIKRSVLNVTKREIFETTLMKMETHSLLG